MKNAMPGRLHPLARFTPSPKVIAKAIGDEMVILDLNSSTYFGLDPVGVRVWQLMSENKTMSGICETLVAEYDVTHERLQQDVARLVDDLLKRKLMTIVE